MFEKKGGKSRRNGLLYGAEDDDGNAVVDLFVLHLVFVLLASPSLPLPLPEVPLVYLHPFTSLATDRNWRHGGDGRPEIVIGRGLDLLYAL